MVLKVLRWAGKAVLAGITALVLLSAVALVYSCTGVHITNETGATDYRWEPNQFRSNMAEGFSWFRMNGDGFNNSFDCSEVERTDILLMGSSHMEACNVAKDRNAGFLLNRSLPQYVTCNIGISGHTIYQCVDNLQAAVSVYRPSEYILIETDRIVLDEGRMQEVLAGKLEHIPSHDSGALYLLQKYIPCFLPLYRNLENWKGASSVGSADVAAGFSGEEIGKEDTYFDTLDRFLEKINCIAGNTKVIIFYHPETIIDANGLLPEPDTEASDTFQQMCADHGITLLDMYGDFSSLYQKEHKLAHGFANTAVGYGHLNEEGHRLIAERLTAEIKGEKNGVK